VPEGDERSLTETQALEAMRRFLHSYWEEFKEARLADVLSEIQPAFFADSLTADPAERDRWQEAVQSVFDSPEPVMRFKPKPQS
jgi:hypothetical protein